MIKSLFQDLTDREPDETMINHRALGHRPFNIRASRNNEDQLCAPRIAISSRACASVMPAPATNRLTIKSFGLVHASSRLSTIGTTP